MVLLFLPPLLIFPNLGDIYLWQDEAGTALLGRCVLQHGYPLAHDGRHLITIETNQLDLNAKGVWIWSPWLSFYLVAASFGVLGESTWSARLPFALIGWGAILMAYALFRDMTRNRWLSRLAVIFLLGSVPFLLHLRQCRYYMLLTLFTLLHLWGYVRMARGERKGAAMFALGGIGLFHSFFPQLVASTAAMGLHAWWLQGGHHIRGRLAKWSAVIAATSLPFFLYAHFWSRDWEGLGHGFDSFWRYCASLKAYFLYVHLYGWPFLLALPLAWRKGNLLEGSRKWLWRGAIPLIGLAGFVSVTLPPARFSMIVFSLSLLLAGTAGLWWLHAMRRKEAGGKRKGMRGWAGLVGLIVALSVMTYAAISPYPFFRYLVGILPLLALATAGTVIALARKRTWAIAILSLVILFSEFVQFGPFFLAMAWGPNGKSLSVNEIKRASSFGHYPTNIATYVLLRVAPNFPQFRSLPWEYFHELTHDYEGPIEGVVKYLEAHGRPEQTLVTVAEPFPLMFYTNLRIYRGDQAEKVGGLPDWVFIHSPAPPRFPEGLRQALKSQYIRAPVDAHETPWENIPEPQLHRFRTPEENRPVTLFRRKGS